MEMEYIFAFIYVAIMLLMAASIVIGLGEWIKNRQFADEKLMVTCFIVGLCSFITFGGMSMAIWA